MRKELDDAEQRYNKFRNAHGTVDLGEESRLLLQQVVDNKTKLLDLQQQRAEMSQRFTANHPAVAALDAQIAALQGAAATMNRSVAVMPDTEQTALRLLRDVHVDTELYTNLLNSAQQLRVAKAGQVGNVRVVDFAETPDEPVRPKRVLAILISLGGGLLIGIMLTFFKRAMYGGVERPDELEGSARRAGVRDRAAQPDAAAFAGKRHAAPSRAACARAAGAGRHRRGRRAQSADLVAVVARSR